MTRGMKRLEQQQGRPIADVLREVAESGMSQQQVGDQWGLSRSAICSWCKRLGIEWKDGRVSGARRRWRRDASRRVSVGGELLTLAEAARRRGLPVGAVRERWQQGDRDAKRLLRPLNVYRDTYELGLTMADWQIITAYAAERGRDAAARKFGVPEGAIRLVQEGEWQCVA